MKKFARVLSNFSLIPNFLAFSTFISDVLDIAKKIYSVVSSWFETSSKVVVVSFRLIFSGVFLYFSNFSIYLTKLIEHGPLHSGI